MDNLLNEVIGAHIGLSVFVSFLGAGIFVFGKILKKYYAQKVSLGSLKILKIEAIGLFAIGALNTLFDYVTQTQLKGIIKHHENHSVIIPALINDTRIYVLIEITSVSVILFVVLLIVGSNNVNYLSIIVFWVTGLFCLTELIWQNINKFYLIHSGNRLFDYYLEERQVFIPMLWIFRLGLAFSLILLITKLIWHSFFCKAKKTIGLMD